MREGVLKGSITIDDFLNIISGHFRFGISLGAPAELMYNNAYYHPGEVLGFVREFTLPEIRGAGALDTYEPAIDAMIALSQTDDFSKQKAKRDYEPYWLTDDKYSQFIGQFSPHEIEDMMYDIIRIVTNDDDPYKGLKDEYNQKALDALYDMDDMIEQQDDPLMAASLVAIAGNALDFANMEAFGEISEKGFSFVDEIGRILQPDTHLVRNDYTSLIERLNSKPNQKIAYAIDNAGEIITDFPLLKRLLEMGHSVVLITRDKHTVNDVSYSDALDLFDREDVRAYFTDLSGNSLLDGAFEITHSGSNVTGTDLRRATRSFVDIWQQADIRLLKGQGNYETLRYYPMKQDMFFLVKIKDPLATARQYAKGDVLIEYRSLNPLIAAYQDDEIDDIISRFRNNLSPQERASIAEFLVFYLDNLSTQADLLTADGNTTRIRELFGQARILLNAATSIPEINTELMGIIHRKIRNDSIISEFLIEYTDLPAGLVNPVQQQNEQFVVIDFASIPATDLSYVYEMIASLEAQRDESDVQVRWVVFSADHSVREIMEALLRRKFYRPGMEIIGQDTMAAVDVTGRIKKVQQIIETSLTSQAIDSNSLKVLAANSLDAEFCARNNMMVLQLDPQKSISQMTDFIAALISMDSFIHGGKIPDLVMESPKTGAIHSVSDILTLQGAVSNTNLLGNVLRLQPSQPAKQHLRRIEHRRVLDSAI